MQYFCTTCNKNPLLINIFPHSVKLIIILGNSNQWFCFCKFVVNSVLGATRIGSQIVQ
jgi:hypothetical protein